MFNFPLHGLTYVYVSLYIYGMYVYIECIHQNVGLQWSLPLLETKICFGGSVLTSVLFVAYLL